ncbi:MAG: hypothetical protein KDK62_05580, partial [Chlamydiia bacterium]|nr:hypothetical protein [Chlamydiia bacterium]
TVEASLKDIKDIANTVKNYLQSAQLIIEVDVDGRVGYEVDPDMNEFINQEVARGEFFTNPEEEEYFQRRYGCLDRKKDIRTLKRYSGVKDKLTTIKDIIRADFVEFCGKNVVSGIPDDFLNQMIEFHGVSVNDVTEAIEPLLKKSLSFFEEKFLSLSKGEGSSNDFEEVLTSIFQQKLFFKATNTSKRQRPPGEIGGYGDILVVELGNECCGIIDAKASPRYSLSSDDYFKMLENYIPNYQELPEALGKKLEFCLYVAGGFNQTSIQNKLSAFSKTASVPVSAITARNLLALCETFTKSQDQVNIREVFKKGKLIEKDDFSG